MRNKDQQQRQDADIVLEAEMLSLKCPVSLLDMGRDHDANVRISFALQAWVYTHYSSMSIKIMPSYAMFRGDYIFIDE